VLMERKLVELIDFSSVLGLFAFLFKSALAQMMVVKGTCVTKKKKEKKRMVFRVYSLALIALALDPLGSCGFHRDSVLSLENQNILTGCWLL